MSRKPAFKNVLANWEMKRWLQFENVDVLVTNTATSSFLSRIAPLPCPVVYFCHGLHWNDERNFSSRIWQTLERLALRNTAGVITMNSDDEAWFAQYLNGSQTKRLYQGVGLPIENFARTKMPPLDSGVKLLWAGEFSKRKRPGLAVEVMSHVIKSLPSAKLTMCGDGALLQDTRDRISALQLDEYISLVGHVEDLPRRLASSHAILMTSEWEGLPRIGLESIAVGRPVYAFDVKGTRSLPDVELVNDMSPASLAEKIADGARANFKGLIETPPEELDSASSAQEVLEFLDQILMEDAW